jgi:hypothetical protein
MAKAPKDDMSGNLRRIAAKFGTTVVGAALYRAGQRIMADSKEHYVPVDLGPLKNSGKVAPPNYAGRGVSVELSFGDAAAAYALAVHEHPSKHSPPSWQGVHVTFSPSGTGPKYLERPLMAAIPTLPHELARDLDLENL